MAVWKLFIYATLICTAVISVYAAALQSLLNSYSYDFYNGTINVTSQADYMVDKDSDGKNDTLIVNITTDAAAGTYRFIIEIINENGILVNSTEKAVTASDSSANVIFPSELLTKQKFNYSIRINDNSSNLVLRKSNIESGNYANYETGINITAITDENVNNNFIRINLTIYSPKAATSNITITLAYNSSAISRTEEKTLSIGIQKISVDFSNETIKSTHSKGNFAIDKIVIGNKIFGFSQNTSIYSHEDFAKTSYIKSIRDGRIDTNNNNLSEFLEINFTLDIKSDDNYTISYDLYDQFNNFVINLSTMQYLKTGEKKVQTLVNGSEIYKTKINAPYVLSYLKLITGNETKDTIFNAHTTSQSFYTDYERPNLPDLKVAINTAFNNTGSTTNITVNLSNIGDAPAFNIFLDIFGNDTYSNNKTVAFMDKGAFITYSFILNTSNTTFFTAITDFDNLVDESNESNNIAVSIKPGSSIFNDMDGDGITDDIDTLIGDVTSINTTINLTVKIGNSTNLLQEFNGTWKISFTDGVSAIMEFDYNLSRVLNLTKIMVERQNNNSFGYTIIHGLSLETAKTVFVDRIDNTINGVCIKDAVVTSISQISEICNANETKVECDGTTQSSYACYYNSTINKYKITGLNHSGIKQIDYAKPITVASASILSGDGSSSEKSLCMENWQCTQWSDCINNLQTRTCQDTNSCETAFNKPKEAVLCTTNEVIPAAEKPEENYELENRGFSDAKNNKKVSLPHITGNFVSIPKNADPGIGSLISSFIVVTGLLMYFNFLHKS